MSICFICRDQCDKLNKICVCADSTICDECMSIHETNNIVSCPICKRELQYIYFLNKNKYIGKIVLNLNIFIIIYGIQLLFPTLIFFHNIEGEYFNNKLFVYLFNIFLVVFVDRANFILFIVSFYNVNMERNHRNNVVLNKLIITLQLMKISIYIAVSSFIYTIYKDNNLLFYFFLITCLSIYVLPFIILIICITYSNIVTYLATLKRSSYYRKIKILGIIHNQINETIV